MGALLAIFGYTVQLYCPEKLRGIIHTGFSLGSFQKPPLAYNSSFRFNRMSVPGAVFPLMHTKYYQ